MQEANVQQYCSILYRMNWSGHRTILTNPLKERWQFLSAVLQTLIQRTWADFRKISLKNCSYNGGIFSANRKQYEILITSSI